ncbi:hypothetical protein EVAR_77222_1 [Eumeta japonica]|uniref:Uncharacterized protein n=1 Tax=Eumeta variegata TaxID=151549 RepID=A0A4C1T336_EUMVA|nr:hypothetical protein EVAR_77222_1 [Eumeta japonica]
MTILTAAQESTDLLVSMGGGDHLSDGSPARSPLKYAINRTVFGGKGEAKKLKERRRSMFTDIRYLDCAREDLFIVSRIDPALRWRRSSITARQSRARTAVRRTGDVTRAQLRRPVPLLMDKLNEMTVIKTYARSMGRLRRERETTANGRNATFP